MNLRAVGVECRYILRIWLRSGSHVVMSVLMPVILLLALGLFFGAPDEGLPVLHVDDQDGTAASRDVVDALRAGGALEVETGPAPAEPDAWLLEHGMRALVRIPAGYGDAPNATRVAVFVIDEGSLEGRLVVGAVRDALTGGPVDEVPLDVVASPPPPSYPAFLLPGVIGVSVVMTGVSIGYASISELRHAGLLQRLAASPLGRTEWLLGRMLGIGVTSLFSVAVLVVVARLVFGPTFVVGPWTFPLVLAGTLVFAGLGTLLGLAVARPEAGAAVMNLVLLPLVLLSGAFFELPDDPVAWRWASWASPLTHLVAGLRADMLGAGDATVPGLSMVAFAVLLLVGGARLIRWTERS